MAFRVIETADLTHLRWMRDFHFGMLIVAYHFPVHDRNEPLHDHDFVEIQLCAGGKGWQQTSMGELPFRRGKALLLRPGAWHRHHDNEQLDAYVCCFESRLLMHELLWTMDEPSLNRLLWRTSSSNEEATTVSLSLDEPVLQRCIAHFEALAAMGENDDSAERATRVGYLTLILACLAQATPDGKAQEFQPVHPAVRRCISLMEEHLADPWNANTLARKLNINVFYLGRVFKAHLGMSPMTYLNQMRVERAARLLNRTDKLVSEIGNEVGWADSNYFARRFRAHFGLSASEYRERHRRHKQEQAESLLGARLRMGTEGPITTAVVASKTG